MFIMLCIVMISQGLNRHVPLPPQKKNSGVCWVNKR